jgi:hypothetical protein
MRLKYARNVSVDAMASQPLRPIPEGSPRHVSTDYKKKGKNLKGTTTTTTTKPANRDQTKQLNPLVMTSSARGRHNVAQRRVTAKTFRKDLFLFVFCGKS